MAEELRIDLTNYRETFSAHIPKGIYRVKVSSTKVDKTKRGVPMIQVWLTVLEGPEKDAVLVERLTIQENTLFRVKGFLNAIGIPTPNKQLLVKPATWIGKVLDVKVRDGEPYPEGAPADEQVIRSEVAEYLKAKARPADPAPVAEPEPLDENYEPVLPPADALGHDDDDDSEADHVPAEPESGTPSPAPVEDSWTPADDSDDEPDSEDDTDAEDDSIDLDKINI